MPSALRRRLAAPLLLGAALGILPHVACSSGSAPASTLRVASLSRDMTPSVTQADAESLALDNARFAFALWPKLVTDDTTNVVYSPISMSIALSMAYAAMTGDMATQTASAMQWSLPTSRLFPAFDQLDLELMSRAPANNVPGVTLDLAEASWADQRLTIDTAYLNTLAVDYGTGVNVSDIADSPDSAAAAINDWAASQTQQNILNLEPPGAITSATRLVLVNATHFSAQWGTQFNPEFTAQASFTRLDGSRVQVPMMDAPGYPNAATGSGYVAVELPYAGNLVSMVMLMPDAGGFASIEAGLTGEFVVGMFKALEATSYGLYVPRFKVTAPSVDIGAALQALGMTDAFTGAGDGFAPALVDPTGPVFIKHVFHEAFLSVDENGTQAAAATAVNIDVDSGAEPAPTTTVTLDHPFFFFLRDIPTNAVLFAGRVVDPTL